jgi:putative addiction module component (TIGR02574 family)
LLVTVEELKLEIEQLSEVDRATIHYYILDLGSGFDDATETEIEAAWLEECKRRVAEYEKDNIKGVSADEMFAQARALAAERAIKRAKKLIA